MAPHPAQNVPASVSRMLMDKVMQEVLVPRHDSLSGGMHVVRAEDGGHVRPCVQRRPDAFDGAWRDHHVGIHEEEDITERVARSVISRRRVRRWSRA